MDTSETYIKMCEKAVEIQDHQLDEGDFYDKGFGGEIWCYEYMADGTWLPRQDQLQEMRPNKISLAYADLGCAVREGFYDGYIDKNGFGYGTPFETDEQLWLAFVMHTLYQKSWDETDWE